MLSRLWLSKNILIMPALGNSSVIIFLCSQIADGFNVIQTITGSFVSYISCFSVH